MDPLLSNHPPLLFQSPNHKDTNFSCLLTLGLFIICASYNELLKIVGPLVQWAKPKSYKGCGTKGPRTK